MLLSHSWSLPDEVCQWIEELSSAALSFYQGIDLLYRKSSRDESILRNEELLVPWVANYYDLGKPEWLIRHARSDAVRSQIPAVLRPDLIPHSSGIGLTEWDSVPGGIGLTAHLEQVYEIGQCSKMIEFFGKALTDAVKDIRGESANMVMAVSEEAGTYLPEMEWICEKLKQSGFSIAVCSPNELEILEDSVHYEGKKVDLIYRFWELFDHQEVSIYAGTGNSGRERLGSGYTSNEAFSGGKVVPSSFPSSSFEVVLEREFKCGRPKYSSVCDSSNMDHGSKRNSTWSLFRWTNSTGNKLCKWTELSKASKKERRLVIKASGFHETAWGGRSVVIGDDMSAEEWKNSIISALDDYPSPVCIMQGIHEAGKLLTSNFFPTIMKYRKNWEGFDYRLISLLSIRKLTGKGHWQPSARRIRKIIHGMRDGSLMPCDKK